MSSSLPPGVSRHIPQCTFLLDANCINARQKDPDLNLLEKWNRDDVITLKLTEVSSDEAAAGGNLDREKKTYDYFATITYAGTPEERATLQHIVDILFPGNVTKTPSQKNDAEIVFNAKKYSSILITNDGASKTQPGGILGHVDELRLQLGVTVMRPPEAVAHVRACIEKRDELATGLCTHFRVPIPVWVGSD